MDRIIFLITSGILLLQTACQRASSPPNIIFILVDDMGWAHLSRNGNPAFETPNIDKLAERGTVFSQAYSSPLCTPTRAALMTGKYPGRLHMTRVGADFDRGELDEPEWFHPASRQKPGDPWDELSVDVRVDLPFDEITMAELAKDAGYRTGFIGKWHCGIDEYYPEHHGFDWVFGGDHWSDYFAPWEGHRTASYEAAPGEYITNRLSREAVRFIEENKDERFFLCLWNYGIHKPIEGLPELVDYYDEKIENQDVYNPVYGAMGHSVDECVGSVIQCLEDNQLMENTLVVFMSDNGPATHSATADMYDPRYILNRNTSNAVVHMDHAKTVVEQEFSNEDSDFRVGFCLAGSGINLSGAGEKELVLKAEVYATGSKLRLINQKKLTAEQLKPNHWHYIQVNEPDSKGNYKLKLILVSQREEISIPIQSTGDNSIPGLNLQVNGQITSGDLYLKRIPRGEKLPPHVQLCTSGPFRGRKIQLYEGGIRVPLFFVWQGVIQPGKEIGTPVAHVDMLPTLSDFMGLDKIHPIDGLSLHSLILEDKQLDDRELHWHYPHYMFSHGGEAIRDERYKYIEFYVDGRTELYDLDHDPGEQNNLINKEPNIAERLRNKMYRWLDSINASMPSPANTE